MMNAIISQDNQCLVGKIAEDSTYDPSLAQGRQAVDPATYIHIAGNPLVLFNRFSRPGYRGTIALPHEIFEETALFKEYREVRGEAPWYRWLGAGAGLFVDEAMQNLIDRSTGLERDIMDMYVGARETVEGVLIPYFCQGVDRDLSGMSTSIKIGDATYGMAVTDLVSSTFEGRMHVGTLQALRPAGGLMDDERQVSLPVYGLVTGNDYKFRLEFVKAD